MNTIKIAWLEDCTWCGCAELNVVTESLDGSKLNLNDVVSCPDCGAVGEIDCDDGCAFVSWAEPEPCPRCGVVSTRPNGEHYCHSDSQAAAMNNNLTDVQFTKAQLIDWAQGRARNPDSRPEFTVLDMELAKIALATLTLITDKQPVSVMEDHQIRKMVNELLDIRRQIRTLRDVPMANESFVTNKS